MNAVMKSKQPSEAEGLAEAFPEVDPQFRPFGYNILLQLRTPKTASKGGIALIEDVRETEKWNTQCAKVVALGPVAYKSRTTMEPWPEGDWCKPGMYVRAPKYGGDRFERPIPGREEKAIFVTCKDLEITGEHSDPLAVVAFI